MITVAATARRGWQAFGSVSVLAGAAFWGTAGTARALGPNAPPAVVGAMRVIVGAAALLVLVLCRRESTAALTHCLRARHLRSWLLVAAVAAAAYQTAFFSAVSRTGVLLGTVVAIGAAPIFTGLVAFAVRREALSARWLAATVAAIVGAVTLLWPAGTTTVDTLGVVLALVASLCYGLYTNAAKELLHAGVATMPVIAGSLALAAVLLLPVVIISPPAWLATPSGMVMIGWLGIAATAAAYLLFASGLRHLPAATVGTLGLAEPLTAAALSLAVLGERLTPRAAIGAGLILVGLLLLTLRVQRD